MRQIIILMILILTTGQIFSEELKMESLAGNISKRFYTNKEVTEKLTKVIEEANQRIEQTAKDAVVIAVAPLIEKINTLEANIKEINTSLSVVENKYNEEVSKNLKLNNDNEVLKRKNDRYLMVAILATSLSLTSVMVISLTD